MSSSSKATVTRPVLTKVNLFEKDLSSFYVTLDTVGLFKNMKISCVLVLRNVVTSLSERDFVVNDIRR